MGKEREREKEREKEKEREREKKERKKDFLMNEYVHVLPLPKEDKKLII